MDLVLARKKARAADFISRVDAYAKASLAPFVLAQDRAQAFDDECLDLMERSGLFAVELDAWLPDASHDRPLRRENGTFADTVAAIRALSRTDPAAAVLVHVHNALVVRAILRFGTDAQKAKWLPRLAGGSIGAFAATEAHAGSDLAKMRCSVETVDGALVLNGEKHWITNAREAGVFLVFAAQKPRGAVAVLVPADAPGVSVGPPLPKMSMRASSTCSVSFTDVRLEPDAILGGPVGGMDVALYGLVCGRIGIAAQMLGLAEGAHRRAVDYARRRQAFGQPIFDFQAVSFPLAQIAAEITAIEQLIKEAVRVLETAPSHLKAMDLANSAKLLAGQLAERAASIAVETLGGNGVAEDFAVEKFYRDAKVGKIYEGTENILLRALAGSLDREGEA